MYNTTILTQPDSTWDSRVGNKIYEDLLNWLDNNTQSYKDVNNLLDVYYLDIYSKYTPNLPIDFNQRVQDYLKNIINKWGFVNSAIKDADTYYKSISSNPNSYDNPERGFVADGLNGARTYDRTVLGYGEITPEIKKRFNDRGWDIYLGYNGMRYIRPLDPNAASNNGNSDAGNVLQNDPSISKDPQKSVSGSGVDPEAEKKRKELEEKIRILGLGMPDKINFRDRLSGSFPMLFDTASLALNLGANGRIARQYHRANQPFLKLSYHTYHNIFGDEGLRQNYYIKGAKGLSLAAQPFTSDADKQMAYQMLAKSDADLLRLQGDLVDNQEIKRTMLLAKQATDANTARDNEIANFNREQIHDARINDYKIKAEHISKNAESLDNFIKGLGTRYNTYLDKISDLDLIDYQDELDSDENYRSLLRQRINLYSKYPNETLTLKRMHPEIIDIEKQIAQYQRNVRAKYLRKSINRYGFGLFYNKRGGKLKFASGGEIPFRVYTPIQSESSGSSKSSKSSKSSGGGGGSSENPEKSLLTTLHGLFEKLIGLPSDTASIERKLNSYIENIYLSDQELDYSDIATIYSGFLTDASKLKTYNTYYEKLYNDVEKKLALGEIAVDSQGRILAQNLKTHKIEIVTPQEYNKGNHNALTNEELLALRRDYRPFDNSYMSFTSNATSLTEITKYLRNLISGLGIDELLKEGYTKAEANDILGGLDEMQRLSKELLPYGPKGYYEQTYLDRNNKELIDAALSFLIESLNPALKTILASHTDDPAKFVQNLIFTKSIQTIHQEFSVINEKTDKSGNKKKSSKDEDEDEESLEFKTNPFISMIRDIGGDPRRYTLLTRDGNTALTVDSRHWAIPNITKDMTANEMISESGLLNGVDKTAITFGNIEMKPLDLDLVMYVNNGGDVATLPCKIVHGVKQVNFDIIEEYNKAENNALKVSSDRSSEEFKEALKNEIEKNDKLKYLLDENGYPNPDRFVQVLIVEAYTTSHLLGKKVKSQFIEEVEKPSKELTGKLKSVLDPILDSIGYDKIDVYDQSFWPEFAYDRVYRANLYIPLSTNLASWKFASSDNTYTNIQSEQLEKARLIREKRGQFNNDNNYE